MPTDHPYPEDRNPPAKGRVIQLSTVHAWDDNRICRKISRSLAEDDYEVILVARAAKSKDSIPPRDVDLHVLPNPRGRIRRGLSSLGIWRRIRRLRPEVVHFHDPELLPTGLILKFLGHRVIYDVHEHVPDDIMEKEWIPTPFRGMVSAIMNVVERVASSRFDAIFAVTPNIAKRFRPDRTTLLRNFPRSEEIIARESETQIDRSGVSNLIFVGGMTPARGIREMVTAVGLASDPNVRLDILGTCDDPSLNQWLERNAQESRSSLHGWVEKSSSTVLLRKARAGMLLYLPSPAHVEALPTKMFEYMAAGIPVIASDFPLWRSIIDKHRCGILVDPSNPQEIAHAIDAIYKDPAEASAMGARGRQAIESEFNWQAEAESMMAVYDHLCHTR